MGRTRRLGTTDMDLSPLGLGTWAIGGGGWAFGWGPQNDAASVAAIRHAVARGVTWIDTAPVYGQGHAEEVVAEALRPLPRDRRPYVFTKCGAISTREGGVDQIGAAASLRAEVEASLRRLEVERLDLCQLHCPPADVAAEEAWQTLLDLKAEGKIRAVGLSNHSPAQRAAAERLGHVDSFQPMLSLLARESAETHIPACRAAGTGVIVHSPLHSGLLSGHFSAARAAALPADDWRARAPEFQGEALDGALAVVEALRPIADRHRTTVAAVAVAWVLAWPGVTGAIVGARGPEQVDAWMEAGRLTLDAIDLDAIAEALTTLEVGAGPCRPVAHAPSAGTA